MSATKKISSLLLAAAFVSAPMASGVWAVFSADFNSDGAVDGSDFITWNANKYTFGAGFVGGDANGDGYTGIFGDLNVMLCQWSIGPSGSTATVSATYDSTLGTGSVTITPSGSGLGGAGAVYLVNNTGTIAGGGGFGGFTETEALPAPPVPAFPATANSSTFFGGFNDPVGAFAPMTTSFTVPASTPVTDLQFFFQLTGQDLTPISIFDSATTTTHLPIVPGALCSCVPEPSSQLALLTVLAMVGFWQRQR